MIRIFASRFLMPAEASCEHRRSLPTSKVRCRGSSTYSLHITDCPTIDKACGRLRNAALLRRIVPESTARFRCYRANTLAAIGRRSARPTLIGPETIAELIYNRLFAYKCDRVAATPVRFQCGNPRFDKKSTPDR